MMIYLKTPSPLSDGMISTGRLRGGKTAYRVTATQRKGGGDGVGEKFIHRATHWGKFFLAMDIFLNFS